MGESKWWKCDLQVATPAWNFKFPADSPHDVRTPEGRVTFLDEYMSAARASGIDLIALADHNTGSWIDEAKAAGERNGVVVFPGCEITTHTGSDGVHLIVLGDLDKTSQDFDRLIYGALGFSHDHPPFHQGGSGTTIPGTSSKTLIQILDSLPDGYLAIAPHAFNENGIASKDTVKGDVRYRALHHERLVAVDPGDCSDTSGNSFKNKFQRRELDDFPGVKDLAFVSTSDAYSITEIGSRFTWIRMGTIGIEGLRQAFLDNESRILCDWSPVLSSFPERNPNNIRHAWISEVHLKGELANSSAPLSLTFHPNLNVIIGGRGSGKSSVVAALRAIYSRSDGLPTRLRGEAEEFLETVFPRAELSAQHRLQESQESQTASWTLSGGSTTMAHDQRTTTRFPVSVISQKELFERAAGDKNDRHLSSRSLLALIDADIGISGTDTRSLDGYGRRTEDARGAWATAVRECMLLQSDLAQLPGLKQQEVTLQRQVDAFSSPAVKQRIDRINARRQEGEGWVAGEEWIKNAIDAVVNLATSLRDVRSPSFVASEPFSDEYAAHGNQAREIRERLIQQLTDASVSAQAKFDELQRAVSVGAWYEDVLDARSDYSAYKLGLQEQGLSTSELTRIQEELSQVRESIRALETKAPSLLSLVGAVESSWNVLLNLIFERREARQSVLNEVEARSGRLRFKVSPLADVAPWSESIRVLAGFRTDAFIDDVPTLATWLWEGPQEGLAQRWNCWRDAMSSGDVEELQRTAKLRAAFVDRLKKLDETIRLRLATQTPDDVAMMEFLKEGASATSDSVWQSITQGSPGQRTAAMLAFVLHHGREPLVLDQPEDDLDSEWISRLVVKELRQSRWARQLIVVSHNANIPVLGDAEQVIALENRSGALTIRSSVETTPKGAETVVPHVGPVENPYVRRDIQTIMEGGVAAFVRREQKYHNETQLVRRQ